MRLPELVITRSGEDVMVSIVPTEGLERVPSDLCCVVDVSGSMSSEAKMKHEVGGQEVGDGLTQLDVVKHSLKTIIKSMDENDRLSLVIFSDSARVIFPLMAMDEAGQGRAIVHVEGLRPQGQTNLWDGLKKGLDTLQEGLGSAPPGCARQVMLLTDGQPNVVPPRGHLPMLQVYKEEHDGSYGCSIQTFGFGTSLDSKLLDEIAAEGNGHYAFIRDSSYVGTCFINALANLQTTISSSVRLSLEVLNGAVLGDVTCYPHLKTSWGALVHPGPVQFGQTRNIVLHIENIPDDAPFLAAHLEMDVPETVRVKAEPGLFRELPESDEVEVQKFRLAEVELIRELVATDSVAGMFAKIDRLVARIADAPCKDDEFVQGLVVDLTDRIRKAVTGQERYRRWGRHYLRSLGRAHLLQASTNFRDVGLKKYGGNLFHACQRTSEEVFLALPPPKRSLRASRPPPRPTPSRSTTSSSKGYTASSPSYSPSYSAPRSSSSSVSMSSYYDEDGPCVAGWCNVQMYDGTKVLVQDIRKNDIVSSAKGTPAKVLCVIKTVIPSGQRDLVHVAGTDLWITPKHPIRVGGTWTYPKDLSKPVSWKIPATYSFVLESESQCIMMIEGVEVATFGDRSNFESPVVKHPFYGTTAIVEELSGMPGWDKGLVQLVEDHCLVRSKLTDKICGFRVAWE